MTVAVRTAGPADMAAVAALRRALWPDADDPAAPPRAGAALFVATDGGGAPVGFAEAAVRGDYVNGCGDGPVAFLEGLYTLPAWRRRGVARALVGAVAGWARGAGLTELASDASADNPAAHAAHRALGFAETERVVFFRRGL